MSTEQAVVQFKNGANLPKRISHFRPSFVEFPSSVKKALRKANNDALKALIDQKSTNIHDPLLPLLLQEAIRLHCDVDKMLASLPDDYNQESLARLGLLNPTPDLDITAS